MNETSGTPNTDNTAGIKFRWSYVLFPLIVLLLSLVLAAIFYPQLNAEIAYRFGMDGSPKSSISRGTITLIMILSQLILTAVSVGIAWVISRAGSSLSQISNFLNPHRIILTLSNMVLLPQIIFCFIMLDIFIYNIYDFHLMPLWVFSVFVMLIGGAVLTVFFVRSFNALRKEDKRNKLTK